ncbi:MAG: oligosaccharide flippase family protein [Candidatus Krumholzibacteria bacterium]
MDNETNGPSPRGDTGEQPAGALDRLVRMLGADTLRYIPSAIIPAGISVASVSIFTRVFDSVEYGRYALVMSTAVIAVMLLSGWIGQSVLRYLPRFRAEHRMGEFIGKLNVVLSGVVLAVTLVFLASRGILASRMDAYAPFLLPAWLLIVAESIFISYGALYQADLRSKDYTVFKISASVLRLVLALLYVLYVSRDIVALVLAAAVANIVLIVPMVVRLSKPVKPRTLWGSLDAGFLKMLAAYGLPMMGWLIASQILGLSDRFIIAAFRGDSEVGIYSANYNLVSRGFGLVSGPILTACYPIIMSAWENGHRETIPGLIATFSRYYLLAVLPIVLCLAVFSRELVSILLGSDFREGHTIIPFILAGVAAWGLSMVGHKGLEIMEKTRVMLRLVVIAAGLNILLNFIFVPRYGYQGAAVTTFASYLSYPLMVWWVSRRNIRWYVAGRTVANLVVSALVTTAVLIGVRALLVGRIAVGLAIPAGVLLAVLAYVGTLLLLREVGADELKMLGRQR